MTTDLRHVPVLVVGAGIMGAGIAQVAALAGHRVQLYDVRPGAAVQATQRLAATLEGLAAKGKLSPEAVQAALARLHPVETLDQAGDVGLVIEAIVEQLEAKRALFRELEGWVAPDAVLATNTSSISVTAIAGVLQRPGRLVGMHFFNPVPLMKLVEVVSGLATDPAVAEAIHRLSVAWGKVPVMARSTPGFIVNRIARPFYAETLAMLQEQAAAPEVLDACLRAAGFRMGPCELMDLIGHDTNFAVTQSVYEANFFDKRFVPSLLQREMVDGGLLGRKSGQGFYRYPAGSPQPVPTPGTQPAWPVRLVVAGTGVVADRLHAAVCSRLAAEGPAGVTVQRDGSAGFTGLQIEDARLVMTDGRPAWAWSAASGTPRVAVFDTPLGAAAGPAEAPDAPMLAFAVPDHAPQDWAAQAAGWLQVLGFSPVRVQDTPGLVVARTVAMLINEAADAVQQGVCTASAADSAMKLGVNYPAGPFEWLQQLGAGRVIEVLQALDAACRGERYRVSPWLRRHQAAAAQEAR